MIGSGGTIAAHTEPRTATTTRAGFFAACFSLSGELWAADAASLLADVPFPVLVVIGKKDVQVDWQADGEVLRRAAGHREDVTFLFPENADHVLKHERARRWP